MAPHCRAATSRRIEHIFTSVRRPSSKVSSRPYFVIASIEVRPRPSIAAALLIETANGSMSSRLSITRECQQMRQNTDREA